MVVTSTTKFGKPSAGFVLRSVGGSPILVALWSNCEDVSGNLEKSVIPFSQVDEVLGGQGFLTGEGHLVAFAVLVGVQKNFFGLSDLLVGYTLNCVSHFDGVVIEDKRFGFSSSSDFFLFFFIFFIMVFIGWQRTHGWHGCSKCWHGCSNRTRRNIKRCYEVL